MPTLPNLADMQRQIDGMNKAVAALTESVVLLTKHVSELESSTALLIDPKARVPEDVYEKNRIEDDKVLIGRPQWVAWREVRANKPNGGTVFQIESRFAGFISLAVWIANDRYRLRARYSPVEPIEPKNINTAIEDADLGPAIYDQEVPIELYLDLNPTGIGTMAIWINGELRKEYAGPLGFLDGGHTFTIVDPKTLTAKIALHDWFGANATNIRGWLYRYEF